MKRQLPDLTSEDVAGLVGLSLIAIGIAILFSVAAALVVVGAALLAYAYLATRPTAGGTPE